MLRSWAEVSLANIAANFHAIRAVAPDADIMPVVKADAYGHGMLPVAHRLCAEGAQWLAVSSFDEGLALRAAGVTSRILVMADRGFDADRHATLTPVIHSLDEIPDTPFHLKVDTGMYRLGVPYDVERIAVALKGKPVEGIMTHFASSSDMLSGQTGEQLARFQTLLGALETRPRYVHAASSNPVHFGLRESWGNLLRPGLALYGYASMPKGQPPEKLLNVRPALEWKARIIAVKDVPAGARIGYGGSFTAVRPMRIAVIGAGYADGLPRRLSNKGPFVGAISMDVSTIDVTDRPDLHPGDAVVLLGEGFSAVDMARASGTIAYEILTGISSRVPRVYS